MTMCVWCVCECVRVFVRECDNVVKKCTSYFFFSNKYIVSTKEGAVTTTSTPGHQAGP